MDHGTTWQWIDSTYNYPSVSSMAVLDTLFFFTSLEAIYRSDDYGTNYYSIQNDMPLIEYPIVNTGESTVLCYSRFPPFSFFYSTDLGNHWDSLPTLGLPQTGCGVIAFTRFHDRFWILTSGIFFFDTIQQSWMETMDSNSHRQLGEMNGSLFASSREDGLIRWDTITSQWLPENYGLETLWVEGFYGEDSCYYVATYVGPYTCDQSYHWEPYYAGLHQINLGSVAFNTNEIWAFTPRGLLVSTDNGTNFSQHAWDSIPDPLHFIMTDSLNVFSHNYNTIINTQESEFFAMNNNLLYHSTDGGISWTALPPDINDLLGTSLAVKGTRLFVSGAKFLYIISYDNYLSMTDDDGETWIDICDNLPVSSSPIITFVKTNEERLFAAPSQNSLWYRDDLLTGEITPRKKNKQSISIYPNPAESKIFLTITHPEERSGTISIYSILGNCIYSDEQVAFSESISPLSIEIGSVVPGLYLLVVKSGKSVYYTKFVKK